MADFKYTDQYPDLDLTASIVKLLDAHGIPNVVWGTSALRAYGHNFLPVSSPPRDVLLAAGFPLCTQGDSCRNVCHDVFPPTPYAHFYIRKKAGNLDYQFPMDIHKKSHLLWAMPEIPLGAPAPGDPDYMLVTDDRLPLTHPGLSTGRKASTHYPIKIPTPARYAEAVLLLSLRDAKPGRELLADHWSNLVIVMEGTDALKLEDLTDPRIRRYYELCRDENTPPCQGEFRYKAQLKVEMMEKKELPDTTFQTLTRGGNE